MQLTTDQYMALVLIAFAHIVYGAVSYWCGRTDRKKVVEHYRWTLKRERELYESQNQTLCRYRSNIDARERQRQSMAELIEELEARQFPAGTHRKSIRMAALQLDMSAQLMTAMKNDENAKTQRMLATELRSMLPDSSKDAAA